MTEDNDRTVTLDELRVRATRISDQARAEVRESMRRLRDEETTRVVVATAVVFAFAVSLAYLAGTRRCAR